MLEPAALNQTRFKTPGVSPDARGVVLGERGVVLFPTVDRLVAFLRAWSAEDSLDALLAGLVIQRVVTPLRTVEVLLSIQAESSYRMDRVAGLAKLAGGMVFTGTSRHFVKYRDSSSPLGYDVQELDPTPADVLLYHDSFLQSYKVERTIPMRELVLRLQLERAPIAEKPERLFATAETGVGQALVRYLFRWRVDARVALAEWPAESAFDDGPRRLHVFDLDAVPPRITSLLASLPGVRVFDPVGETVGVELGYKHPIALDSCASLFEEGSLTLFRSDTRVDVLAPLPPFSPVRALVRTDVRLDDEVTREASGGDAQPTLSLPLRLRASTAPWRQVVASVIPRSQRAWLAKILYALPPGTLSALRLAEAEDRVFLIDPHGIEGVPLGTFFTELAPRVYVPAGMMLVPQVAPDVLLDLVEGRGDGHVFFEAGALAPTVVAESAFGPVSRRAIRSLRATPEDGEPLTDGADAPLPLLEYGPAAIFPLSGVVGRTPRKPASSE